MARRTNPGKREMILRSAIHVFSEKTYEKTRVSDIARHAGIAYGLVYHYFQNKEEILNCIFQEKWSVFVKVLRQIDGDKTSLEDKLAAVAEFLLEGIRVMPELMRLIMLEINRRIQFLEPEHVEHFREVFQVLQGMLERHQQRGELRADLDPALLAFMFFGSVQSVVLAHIFDHYESGSRQDLQRLSRGIASAYMKGIAP